MAREVSIVAAVLWVAVFSTISSAQTVRKCLILYKALKLSLKGSQTDRHCQTVSVCYKNEFVHAHTTKKKTAYMRTSEYILSFNGAC